MKLIEVNNLIKDINSTEILKDFSSTYFKLIDLIRNQPVAYDVDKVCEQIKQESDYVASTNTNINESHTEVLSYITTKDALEIIKSCGVPSPKVKPLTEKEVLNNFDLENRRVYGVDEIERIIRKIFK